MNSDHEITAFLKEYQPVRENLIPILQAVQEKEGFLSKEILFQIAQYLNMPTGKVYGVATFYNQFRFRSQGKWILRICRGAACHARGVEKLIDFLCGELEIQPGETTPDGLFTLEVSACLGVCGFAPVMTVNGTVYSSITEEKLRKILDDLRKGERT